MCIWVKAGKVGKRVLGLGSQSKIEFAQTEYWRGVSCWNWVPELIMLCQLGPWILHNASLGSLNFIKVIGAFYWFTQNTAACSGPRRRQEQDRSLADLHSFCAEYHVFRPKRTLTELLKNHPCRSSKAYAVFKHNKNCISLFTEDNLAIGLEHNSRLQDIQI